jgi:hypothetical protein
MFGGRWLLLVRGGNVLLSEGVVVVVEGGGDGKGEQKKRDGVGVDMTGETGCFACY